MAVPRPIQSRELMYTCAGGELCIDVTDTQVAAIRRIIADIKQRILGLGLLPMNFEDMSSVGFGQFRCDVAISIMIPTQASDLDAALTAIPHFLIIERGPPNPPTITNEAKVCLISALNGGFQQAEILVRITKGGFP